MGANLKEVRIRIKSVINTQQITKAMKMVSAAKLRHAQGAIVEMRPYADRLQDMLKNILSNLDGDVNIDFGVERPLKKVLVVVVTSNKGLAGAFNSNIIKAAKAKIEGELATAEAIDILCIGKKGFDAFKKSTGKINVITDHVALFEDLSFANSSVISQNAMDQFSLGEYDRVEVAYSKFKNAGVQYHQCETFLPVPKIEAGADENVSKFRADFIFEPDKATLLNRLIPNILKTQFHKYLLDTHASEHGARMTAMDKATENANDLLQDLRIHYNKARQVFYAPY